MRGINRMKVGADRRGTRKSALTGSQRFKLDKRLKETWEKKEKLAAEKVEEGPVRKKRRYITADMALGLQNTTDG